MVPTRGCLFFAVFGKCYLSGNVAWLPIPQFTLLSLFHLLETWKLHVVAKRWLYPPRDGLPLTTLFSWIPHVPLTFWVSKGINTLGQLYSGHTLNSFSDIHTMYPYSELNISRSAMPSLLCNGLLNLIYQLPFLDTNWVSQLSRKAYRPYTIY